MAALLIRSGISAEEQEPAATRSTPTATAPASTATAPPPPTATTTDTTGGVRFYTIESGDTLEGIASDSGTTVEALLELNPELDPVALTVGQRIRVG